MIIAVTDLAAQTGKLSMTTARGTLQGFIFDALAGGLMLELVIFAKRHRAECTHKHAASVLPNAALTLAALHVPAQWTLAPMNGQAAGRVTYPGLTVITYCTLKMRITKGKLR